MGLPDWCSSGGWPESFLGGRGLAMWRLDGDATGLVDAGETGDPSPGGVVVRRGVSKPNDGRFVGD